MKNIIILSAGEMCNLDQPAYGPVDISDPNQFIFKRFRRIVHLSGSAKESLCSSAELLFMPGCTGFMPGGIDAVHAGFI